MTDHTFGGSIGSSSSGHNTNVGCVATNLVLEGRMRGLFCTVLSYSSLKLLTTKSKYRTSSPDFWFQDDPPGQ